MNNIKIDKVNVYGLEESIQASRYPMSIDVDSCSIELTNTTKKLGQCDTGTGHDNFLNGIIVQFNLTAPVKMWTEIQRYHFMDFVSSQSTIHRITQFDLSKQYDKHVDTRIVDILKEKINEYKRLQELESKSSSPARQHMMHELYLDILMSNPTGFNLTARMTTNYRQLKTIYQQRKYHILPHWHEFCDWCLTLPYFEELTQKKNKIKY